MYEYCGVWGVSPRSWDIFYENWILTPICLKIYDPTPCSKDYLFPTPQLIAKKKFRPILNVPGPHLIINDSPLTIPCVYKWQFSDAASPSQSTLKNSGVMKLLCKLNKNSDGELGSSGQILASVYFIKLFTDLCDYVMYDNRLSRYRQSIIFRKVHTSRFFLSAFHSTVECSHRICRMLVEPWCFKVAVCEPQHSRP